METQMSPENRTPSVVQIKPKIWIENGPFGDRNVVVHYPTQGGVPFVYATFHYQYGYTDNASTHLQAEKLARALGAKDPIEHRCRTLEQTMALDKKPALPPELSYPMHEMWSVSVKADGEDIVQIGHSWLSGKSNITDMDERTIIGAAEHLLGFVGYGLPPSSFSPEPEDQASDGAMPEIDQLKLLLRVANDALKSLPGGTAALGAAAMKNPEVLPLLKQLD